MKFERGLAAYFAKWRGTTAGTPPRVSYDEIFWSMVGSALGLAALVLAGRAFFDGRDAALLLGSFGASAVLIFGAPRSPLAQPRNLIGGHLLSALIGVVCWQMFHPYPGVPQALAVALAIGGMHATRTLHPPGGATALIATLGSPEIVRLGYAYVLAPVLAGAGVLLMVALVINNLPRTRRYPEIWF